MQANRLDGCPSSFSITLLICLRCSDNDFGVNDLSREVLYYPGGRIDLLHVVFSRVYQVQEICIKGHKCS